jgi:chromosome partitioning protein
MAANLAVASGVKTALFDLDPQESVTVWAERRAQETPHVEFLTERRLPAALKAAEDNGFELVIIDTPPAAGPQAYAAAQCADLILIPCRPSKIDLDALRRTANLVKTLNVPAFVVINAAPPTATLLLDEARTLIAKEGLDICPAVLRERSAFRVSWAYRKGVTEYEPRGKAAKEIVALKEWAFSQLQDFTTSRMKGKAHG